MLAVHPMSENRLRVMWLALGLALVAALSYLLIIANFLAVGDLQTSEKPAEIVYVCAGCYLLGGLLILLRWRWLWIAGAVINALVMLFFFSMYANRPEVMVSPGGLATKAAQILLEVCLLYLIFTEPRRAQSLR